MEALIGEDIKFFDDTAAFIHGSVPSIYPSGPTKEPCEIDSNAWFVKTEAISPVRNITDVVQDSGGLQLGCEPSLNMFIKTEVTSPAREQVEECSISPSVLPKESCQDHNDLSIKIEPASPERNSSDIDQTLGLQMEYELSLEMSITSPTRQSPHEKELLISRPGNTPIIFPKAGAPEV